MLDANHIVLLAADDWWQIVGGLIFMVLYGVGQLLSGRAEGKKRAPRPKQRRPQPPAAQPGPPGQPPNQADPLRAEVEEFLRRAQGQPAEQEQLARETRPVRRESARSGQGRQRPSEPSQRQPATQAPPRRISERTPPDEIDLRHENVEEHVTRHLSSKGVTERASHLGEEIALADEKIEAHLEKKFEHRLGNLEHRKEIPVLANLSDAEQLRKLLSDPEGMRQLMVINEVLRRPDDHW